MLIHVISLPRRSDRRAQFAAWNAHPGLEISFEDAVDGADLQRAALVAQGLLASDSAIFSAGAIGCALSHHKMWMRAAAAPAPMIVCEDDACLRGNFLTLAEQAIKGAPNGWDIIFLGFNTDAILAVQFADGLKALLSFDESAKKTPGYFEAYSGLSAPASTLLQCYQIWGMLAYAISPRGAARLLEACYPLDAANPVVMFGQNRTLRPYGIDGMINLTLQRAPTSAYCLVPPIAVSANDHHDSDASAR